MNFNVDTVTSGVTEKVGIEKCIIFTDVLGILKNFED
jgi:acetylglutamate kinase